MWICTFRQSRLQNTISQKTERRSLHIDKGSIHQEDLMIVNIYALNVSTLNFIKETLLDIKTQIDPNTIIVDDFNTPLSQYIGHPYKKSQ
jgi:hypothetical protein